MIGMWLEWECTPDACLVVCVCVPRYTLCYVYEPRFEIGGAFWPHCLKWIIRIMYLSQAFMLCVFVLREYVRLLI